MKCRICGKPLYEGLAMIVCHSRCLEIIEQEGKQRSSPQNVEQESATEAL